MCLCHCTFLQLLEKFHFWKGSCCCWVDIQQHWLPFHRASPASHVLSSTHTFPEWIPPTHSFTLLVSNFLCHNWASSFNDLNLAKPVSKITVFPDQHPTLSLRNMHLPTSWVATHTSGNLLHFMSYPLYVLREVIYVLCHQLPLQLNFLLFFQLEPYKPV